MKLNGQRKALLVIAGVGCAAVLADQVFMGGEPQGADASAVVPTVAMPAPGAATPASDGVPGANNLAVPEVPTGPSLAERLREAEGELRADTPDAFAPTGRWERAATPGAGAGAGASGGTTFDPATFARRYPLDGVMFINLEPQAIVNGKPMRVGESLDGVTLEAIGDRWVIWSGPGSRFRVRLDVGGR